MIEFKDVLVAEVFGRYPEDVRERMYVLRNLIFTTVQGNEGITEVTETLKWGEPSYLCKSGSSFRIGWKASDPQCYRMFFHCQSKLIPTFRELFSGVFDFEGNRSIRFRVENDVDLDALAVCIEAALRYHVIKGLPLLGLQETKGGI